MKKQQIHFLILAAMGTIFPANPAFPQQQASAKVEFSTANMEKAIDKGCEWLLGKQLADGSWGTFISPSGLTTTKVGPTGIAIYALIASGVPASDPKIQKAMEWLVANDLPPTESEPSWTYDKAFCCLAYHAANKQLKNKYLRQLEADVRLLCLSHAEGKYNYRLTGKLMTGSYYDNSNSQYALYGIWTGARAGLEIPKEFWNICLKHWISEQQADGAWKYYQTQTEIRSGMVVAGLASLFVCIDYLYADKFIRCETPNEFAPIKKGLDWMEKNFESTLSGVNSRLQNFNYYLYGVERVGLASGYRYFGKYDWFKTIATLLLNAQEQDGSWRQGHSHRNDCKLPENFDSTCYALLFLARGLKPMLFNRLEYDGDWNNRPRALANFCRWAEGVYESEVNWQIVTLKSDAEEWHDAPVVTITGSKAPKFTDEDLSKLQAYVLQGGTIFGITECNGAGFSKGVKEVYRKIFPKYELTALGKDNPLYSAHYQLGGMPKIYVVHNGIRPLAIHTDADLPLSWQTYSVATGRKNFEAAANVLSYVTERQLAIRGEKVWPAKSANAPAKTIKVARLRYAGNYDPEPLALERLGRLLSQAYKTGLDFAAESSASAPADSAVPVTGIAATALTSDVKVAFLTGTGAFKLSDAEKDALKKWADAGGLLVIDAAGGGKDFADSAKELLAGLWGQDALVNLPISSPIYQMKDLTVDKVKYRKATRTRLGPMKEPRLQAILAGEKPKVIFSPEDLTAGLVGYNAWGVDGYEPQSAFELTRNIILFAAGGK